MRMQANLASALAPCVPLTPLYEDLPTNACPKTRSIQRPSFCAPSKLGTPNCKGEFRTVHCCYESSGNGAGLQLDQALWSQSAREELLRPAGRSDGCLIAEGARPVSD